jgi:hypothetical protein
MGGSKHAVIPSNPSRVIDPPAKWVERSNVNKNGSTSSARERHGLFRLGAFAAAHLIQYSEAVLMIPPSPEYLRA